MNRLEKANVRRAFRALIKDAKEQRNKVLGKVGLGYLNMFASAEGYLNGLKIASEAMEKLMSGDETEQT